MVSVKTCVLIRSSSSSPQMSLSTRRLLSVFVVALSFFLSSSTSDAFRHCCRSVQAIQTSGNAEKDPFCRSRPCFLDRRSAAWRQLVPVSDFPLCRGAVGAAPVPREERFPFQAEVKRVLDIIVNSLYTDKDVFLRELMSNAADACDKKKVLLQQSSVDQLQSTGLSQTDDWRGSIRVYPDKVAGTLTIEDDGIGMSKTELIDNLGTIAKSGTYKFAKHLEELSKEKQTQPGDSSAAAADLIGQFGVGFYSAFLVADKVDVISARWPDTKVPAAAENGEGAVPDLWKWSSSCGQTFSIEQLNVEEERRRRMQQLENLERDILQAAAKQSKTLSVDQQKERQGEIQRLFRRADALSGTRVVLHLKEECDDYLEDYRLRELLKKYSEFLPIPIYLLSERVEYERVPDPGSTESADSNPKFKTVTTKYTEWAHLNTQPPIWRRPESSLTEKDYVDFYKATFKVGEVA